jgi:replicative superfamily II helicase
MVDFSKRLKGKSLIKKVDPIEIYDTLDRSSDTGPLRPAQKAILQKWVSDFKMKKDVILKLHTGQGKTLIGLLILQSSLNENKFPVLYVCPNKQLVSQTCDQARKFGIHFCLFGEDNSLPSDFLNGKSILICNVKKLFNGLSKFGLGNRSQKAAIVVLDDAHACIESIKEAFSIKLESSDSIYDELVELFDEDLQTQGLGTYSDLRQNSHDAFLPVPYWTWKDNLSKIVKILGKNTSSDRIKFSWPILKDSLENCQCFVSGTKLEITPFFNPIDKFGTFYNAEHRILMSASTLDDSFFVKGLRIDIKAIENPLKDINEKWSGEKMLLIPSLISENLDRVRIVNEFLRPKKRKFGIVALIPSFRQAKLYENQDCIIANANTIQDSVLDLKKGNYEFPLVIVNRYDGIDLPDENCRILVIDSKPYGESLTDKYEELCIDKSDSVKTRIAQRIEQGLGRSVRGEKDYSVIIIIGSDLVAFIRNTANQKYFSAQTKNQINIGLQISELALEDLKNEKDPDDIKALISLINQSINRDDGWKDFYEEKMNEETMSGSRDSIGRIFEIEKLAEEANFRGEHDKACETLQKLIDNNSFSDSEKGWYLQHIARFKYNISKVESNKIQIAAYKLNLSLIKPKNGINYEKLSYISDTRIKNIKNQIEQIGNYGDLILRIDEISSSLSFGEDAEKFERALHELGGLLGYTCQRPDREIKQGPDNLWCVGKNDYILFECKNEISENRTEISRKETGQMNNSCGWFALNYPGSEVKRILIAPVKNIARSAAFNHDVEIMRKGKLKDLVKNVKSFFKEFAKVELTGITDEFIQTAIETHKLELQHLKSQYTEVAYQLR